MFLVLVSVLTLVIVLYLWKKQQYWKTLGVYTTPSFLLFGHITELVFRRKCLGEIVKENYDQLKQLGEKCGGIYSFKMPIFIPIDLDLVQQILLKDFSHFTDHGKFVEPELSPLTNHLFNLKGEKWRRIRSKLNACFTSGRVKLMMPNLLRCSRDLETVLERCWSQRDAINIKDVSARFTSDVIMSCALGLNGDCLKNPQSEFWKHANAIFQPNFRLTLILLTCLTWPEVITYFRLQPYGQDMNQFFLKLTKDALELNEMSEDSRVDLLSILLSMKNKQEDEEGLTMDEITSQVFLFFIAGFEPSSTTTTYCMYELAQHPHIQEKAREEILTVLYKYHGEVTYEALHEMTYLERCINETLRKYPPVPLHTRTCTQPYKVPNSKVRIHKGEQIFVPVLGIHNDRHHYPYPEKFDPDRFLPENVLKRHPAAWIPFGIGPRQCIGIRFGVLQTKIALVFFLRNHCFSVNHLTELPIRFDWKNFLLAPQGNILLNFEPVC